MVRAQGPRAWCWIFEESEEEPSRNCMAMRFLVRDYGCCWVSWDAVIRWDRLVELAGLNVLYGLYGSSKGLRSRKLYDCILF